MKLKHNILIFLISGVLCNSCFLNGNRHSEKKEPLNFEDEIKLENQVINQIIPSLLDSCDHFFKLNKIDLNKVSCIYYSDSLSSHYVDYQEVKWLMTDVNIQVDSMYLNDKEKGHFIPDNLILKSKNRFCKVSTHEDFKEIAKISPEGFIYLRFSRFLFNKNRTEGAFYVYLGLVENSGYMLVALVINENSKWHIKRTVRSGVI